MVITGENNSQAIYLLDAYQRYLDFALDFFTNLDAWIGQARPTANSEVGLIRTYLKSQGWLHPSRPDYESEEEISRLLNVVKNRVNGLQGGQSVFQQTFEFESEDANEQSEFSDAWLALTRVLSTDEPPLWEILEAFADTAFRSTIVRPSNLDQRKSESITDGMFLKFFANSVEMYEEILQCNGIAIKDVKSADYPTCVNSLLNQNIHNPNGLTYLIERWKPIAARRNHLSHLATSTDAPSFREPKQPISSRCGSEVYIIERSEIQIDRNYCPSFDSQEFKTELIFQFVLLSIFMFQSILRYSITSRTEFIRVAQAVTDAFDLASAVPGAFTLLYERCIKAINNRQESDGWTQHPMPPELNLKFDLAKWLVRYYGRISEISSLNAERESILPWRGLEPAQSVNENLPNSFGWMNWQAFFEHEWMLHILATSNVSGKALSSASDDFTSNVHRSHESCDDLACAITHPREIQTHFIVPAANKSLIPDIHSFHSFGIGPNGDLSATSNTRPTKMALNIKFAGFISALDKALTLERGTTSRLKPALRQQCADLRLDLKKPLSNSDQCIKLRSDCIRVRDEVNDWNPNLISEFLDSLDEEIKKIRALEIFFDNNVSWAKTPK